MYIVSFILGLIIVFSSIFLIRRELNRALLKQSQLIEQSRFYEQEDLFSTLEALQISINDMNHAFYDIAGDLEGKISVHQKEIELLQDELRTRFVVEQRKKTRDSIQVMQAPQEVPQELPQQMPQSKETTSQSETYVIDQIIEMRSRGLPLTQIAKELGIGMGELQLLLSLKK